MIWADDCTRSNGLAGNAWVTRTDAALSEKSARARRFKSARTTHLSGALQARGKSKLEHSGKDRYGTAPAPSGTVKIRMYLGATQPIVGACP